MPNYSGIFLKRLFEIMEENVGQINLAFEACTSDDNTTKFDQGMFFSSKYRRTLPFAYLYIVFLTLNRNTMVSFKLFKSFVCKEQKDFFFTDRTIFWQIFLLVWLTHSLRIFRTKQISIWFSKSKHSQQIIEEFFWINWIIFLKYI